MSQNNENKKTDKKLLKIKLVLLLFKEAQRLIQYEFKYRNLSAHGNKMFGSENQQITLALCAFNQDLNKAICDMERSEAKCRRYEELIFQLKRNENL